MRLPSAGPAIGRYAPAMFSVHMGQHMLMSMLDRMLDTISQAQAGAKFVSTDEFKAWRAQVDSVKTELSRRSEKMAGQISNTYRVIQYTQFMESTLKNTMSPQLSASPRCGRGLSAQGLR